MPSPPSLATATTPTRAPHVVSFGECMLELQGEAFGTLRQNYGGDTLNTAVYLARCGSAAGLRVSYATGLGEDRLSDGLLSRWAADDLGTGLVRRLPGRLPGLYMIELESSGERRFHYWRDQSAARAYFDTAPGQTPLEAGAEEIDALYLSGISLAILPPAGRQRLRDLAVRLRQRGAAVVFDNNYRPRLWADLETARSEYRAMMEIASIALVTLDDEQALWGEPYAAAQIERTLATPCPEIVIKRGAAATLVRRGGKAPIEVPTEAVVRVVDTTAAGDSFAGAYLAARMTGRDALDAAQAGNRLAAIVIQHPGAVIAAADMKGFFV